MKPVNIIMQPIRFLLLAALLLSLVGSCGKTGQDPAPTTPSVIGNWRISAITINPAASFGGPPITDLLAYLR